MGILGISCLEKFYVKQNLEGSEDDIEEDLVDPQDKGFKKARFANTVGAMTSGTTLDEEEYNQKKLMCRMGEQEQPWTKPLRLKDENGNEKQNSLQPEQ